ncbi:DUF1127 domain-containing protein [Aliivibrio finisterrensis]|uniref:DUF1127 domain-containing protein n=1 Tax=Aliivibrio finisterrensis TaxID=511998 RepID=A0A6N6RS78_9GAMM|nr:DUF1127 domain-containing protein [Aliivibrio finisterrensis]KAB2824381.1 DUF1127 domain-containing protein [Aliivibrio finisterrensis]RYU70049.1 DUF1127 domain-containing protein [Aliivibrio finisterrensis]RYU73838.1 DUF1127 domain-containing protein [Aliivibrio finisterrensis]RYU76682.1 DUF1127 domain-containing protein [Aliivibrio finisterrensis]
MRHSLYLRLATLLIKADLAREEREWKRKVRKVQYEIPWGNEYLLRDIGLHIDGRTISDLEVPAIKTERQIRHLRRLVRLRIAT